MKRILLNFTIILLILFSYTNASAQLGADSLLTFIQNNNSRSSIFLTRNDTVISSLNENKLMPLASTAKILVTLEFAKQAAFHVFDENKKVSLKELNKYYLPNTDGNAHPDWINFEKQKGNITGDSVKLIDVARGMILFSSNANTEYLMDLLGTDNINNNYRLLNVKKFTPLYPWVSALFLYQNPKHLKEEKILNQIENLTDDQYRKASFFIHNQLKYDSAYKQKFRIEDLSLKMQKEWSDRLPASTTQEYVHICSILNNRKIFNDDTYKILSTILETLMENPANRQGLTHAGMKDGSTIFVLTKAMYATLKNGTKIELAYFFNDLTQQENERLQKWMNDFELKIFSDDNFRKEIQLKVHSL